MTQIAVSRKLSAIRSLLDKASVFLEFAPGDCRFSFAAAQYVRKVYGVDISDQRDPTHLAPENFELVVYDGHYLNQIENDSIDVIFSDQLIEHFLERDTRQHFELAYRILKPGGQYLFRTPHYLTGPHDVSQYFSYEPECFHLKEWTFAEIEELLSDTGYSQLHTYWSAKGIHFRLPRAYFSICEFVFGRIPKRYIRELTRYFIPSLCMSVVK